MANFTHNHPKRLWKQAVKQQKVAEQANRKNPKEDLLRLPLKSI